MTSRLRILVETEKLDRLPGNAKFRALLADFLVFPRIELLPASNVDLPAHHQVLTGQFGSQSPSGDIDKSGFLPLSAAIGFERSWAG